MKFKNVNRGVFKNMVCSASEAAEIGTTLHIFKKYAIRNIIGDCHYNGKVVVFNGDVYTVENNEQRGDLYDVLWNIAADSIGEWMARVELGLLP